MDKKGPLSLKRVHSERRQMEAGATRLRLRRRGPAKPDEKWRKCTPEGKEGDVAGLICPPMRG